MNSKWIMMVQANCGMLNHAQFHYAAACETVRTGTD